MKLYKWPFANQAIKSTYDAFFREDFFGYESNPSSGGEYYKELSCGKDLPICSFSDDEDDLNIQGIFHFLTDSASDLWLVCSYFAEKGEDFFVFFACRDEDRDKHAWVVWLPNAKHLN